MDIEKIIRKETPLLVHISDTLWNYAETAFSETRSAGFLCHVLEEKGFHVTRNAYGLETAFLAEYGQGKPVIALLAEYDALPNLSQKVSPVKEPDPSHTAGHGCGHNLLGAGSVAAALAVKEAIDAHEVSGTIRLYGTPAEEVLLGKVILAKHGHFQT